MRYAIYARVSPRGDMEKETSISMQIEFCKTYIREQGGTVEVIEKDEFFSGKNMNRPGFKKLISSLESGKAKWDCICVYKLSRLSRSLRDGAVIFDKLFQHGKGFVSVTERNLDFSTPAGRAMLGILQVFNQFEREQTVENTRNKLISIAAKGLWPVGHPPFGYCRHAAGDNKLYPDPVKAAIVQNIFQMYCSPQFTTKDILAKYHFLSSNTVLRILKDPVYLGKIPYNGEIYHGQHEPLISESLFAEAQANRATVPTSSRPKAQRYPYLLAGVLTCRCGHALTPASAKSGKYHYYQCTEGGHQRIKAEAIEEAVLNSIKLKPIPDRVLHRVREKIAEAKSKQANIHQPEIDRLNAALGELEKRRDGLVESLIGTTAEVKTLLNEKIEACSQQMSDIRERLSFLKTQTLDGEDIYQLAEHIVNEIRFIQDTFRKASDDKVLQRQAVLMYIQKIQQQESGEFKITYNYTGEEEGVRLSVKNGVACYILNELFSITFRLDIAA